LGAVMMLDALISLILFGLGVMYSGGKKTSLMTVVAFLLPSVLVVVSRVGLMIHPEFPLTF
jgi:hypothetical protein